MTLAQYIVYCRKAISANFRSRNVKVLSGQRQQRLQLARRSTVSAWVRELRRALSPETANEVARQVLWKIN